MSLVFDANDKTVAGAVAASGTIIIRNDGTTIASINVEKPSSGGGDDTNQD